MTKRPYTWGPLTSFIILALNGLTSLADQPTAVKSYDPLQVVDPEAGMVLELTVKDVDRDREIPLQIHVPSSAGPRPVVLFSHGLGGTNQGCRYLGEHWSARGYLVVFLQHPGSDDSVWRDLPLRERMPAMRDAASLSNLIDRIADVRRTIDELEDWKLARDHALRGKCDLQRLGMSGHSFGAITTQAVSGQNFPLVRQRNTDSRIQAAISFSPSPPRQGSAKSAFGKVAIPWMLITGTRDDSFIGNYKADDRKLVFKSLSPKIDRYELILLGATHSAFVDRPLPWDRGHWNPKHHAAVMAVSTAFWDAHLVRDKAARTWLHGSEPRSVLDENDRWQVQLKGTVAGPVQSDLPTGATTSGP